MGRKKIPHEQSKQLAALRQDLTGTVKSIDQYRPYVKDVILCAQHLWIMSNQYMLTKENLQDDSKAPEMIKHLCILRDFHENVLRIDIELVKIRNLISQSYLKELRTMQNALEISAAFTESCIPLLSGINGSVIGYLSPIKEIYEVYGEKIKETLGDGFYQSMTTLLLNVDQKQLETELGEDVIDTEEVEDLLQQSIASLVTEEEHSLTEIAIPLGENDLTDKEHLSSDQVSVK